MTDSLILNQRYRIEKQLGQGAFAIVHRAHDQLLDRPVAVKLLHPWLLTTLENTILQQFQREARAAARLQHSHVVHIYDLGEHGNQFFLVQEYLAGGDLAARLVKQKERRFSLAQTIAILQPIASALEAAHASGIVHRDVKPQNILFRADGAPVLTDFGLAKLVQDSLSLDFNPRSADIRLGTPGYTAPEQIDETLAAVGPATDVFALAVIAYELLTGKTAFVGSTPDARNYQTMHGDRGKLLAALPTAARAALQAGLAVDPAARPPTPRALLQLFKQSAPAAPKTSAAPNKAGIISGLQKWLTQPSPTTPKPSIAPSKANPAGIEWVEIPAGKFLCGSRFIKEKAIVSRPYRIGKYPVTNAQYKLFLDANPQYPAPKDWDQAKRAYPPGKGKHPVVYVNLDDARAFCDWANCRLPSEFEWEKAARGTDGRVYPWGDNYMPGLCNVKSESSTPVDTFPEGASPYGVWDMIGNVWEWTSGGALRGGAWDDSDLFVCAAYRDSVKPGNRNNNIGFRCAQE